MITSSVFKIWSHRKSWGGDDSHHRRTCHLSSFLALSAWLISESHEKLSTLFIIIIIVIIIILPDHRLSFDPWVKGGNPLQNSMRLLISLHHDNDDNQVTSMMTMVTIMMMAMIMMFRCISLWQYLSCICLHLIHVSTPWWWAVFAVTCISHWYQPKNILG